MVMKGVFYVMFHYITRKYNCIYNHSSPASTHLLAVPESILHALLLNESCEVDEVQLQPAQTLFAQLLSLGKLQDGSEMDEACLRLHE